MMEVVCGSGSLTTVQAGLHEDADGLDAQLEVLGRDVGGVAHDEGQRLHALDEGLGVVQAHVLAQGQAVLVDEGRAQGLGPGGRQPARLQVVFANLTNKRTLSQLNLLRPGEVLLFLT